MASYLLPHLPSWNTRTQPEEKASSLCSTENFIKYVTNPNTAQFIIIATLVIGLFWAIIGGNIALAVVLCIGTAAQGWLLYKSYCFKPLQTVNQ